MTKTQVVVTIDTEQRDIVARIRAEIARILSEQLQSDPNAISSFSVTTQVEAPQTSVNINVGAE